jgi:hypothetical protein
MSLVSSHYYNDLDSCFAVTLGDIVSVITLNRALTTVTVDVSVARDTVLSFVLKMEEAACTPETTVSYYQNTQHNVPEASFVHIAVRT